MNRTTQANIRIDPATRARLAAIAIRNHTSLSGLIRLAIDRQIDHIDRHGILPVQPLDETVQTLDTTPQT
jgi:hypothetical protein